MKSLLRGNSFYVLKHRLEYKNKFRWSWIKENFDVTIVYDLHESQKYRSIMHTHIVTEQHKYTSVDDEYGPGWYIAYFKILLDLDINDDFCSRLPLHINPSIILEIVTAMYPGEGRIGYQRSYIRHVIHIPFNLSYYWTLSYYMIIVEGYLS